MRVTEVEIRIKKPGNAFDIKVPTKDIDVFIDTVLLFDRSVKSLEVENIRVKVGTIEKNITRVIGKK